MMLQSKVEETLKLEEHLQKYYTHKCTKSVQTQNF
jgi:hypothetical protein